MPSIGPAKNRDSGPDSANSGMALVIYLKYENTINPFTLSQFVSRVRVSQL